MQHKIMANVSDRYRLWAFSSKGHKNMAQWPCPHSHLGPAAICDTS